MPYIRGFTFPSDICNFLGINVSSEMKKQKARMLTAKKPTSWMKKFFPTMPEAASDVGKKRNSVTCRSAVKNCSIPCPMDIGEPVLVTGASRGKALCHSATGFWHLRDWPQLLSNRAKHCYYTQSAVLVQTPLCCPWKRRRMLHPLLPYKAVDNVSVVTFGGFVFIKHDTLFHSNACREAGNECSILVL